MKLRVLGIAMLALVMAACGSYGGRHGARDQHADMRQGSDSRDVRAGVCFNCGIVTLIHSFDDGPRGNGAAGAVAGAVVGGVLGSQIGSGSGRDAATVVGAVAGGVAGREIQRSNARERHELTVQMHNGHTVRWQQDRLDGVREGSRVVIRDGRFELI